MQIFKPKRKSRKREGRSRKGEGSVYQRGGAGSFYFKIPDPHGGKPLTGSCQTEDHTEAVLYKNREIVRINDGLPKPAGVATIDEILNDYEKYCEEDKQKSWRSLKVTIAHLRKAFGPIVADELTTADTDRFRAEREGADGCEFTTVNRELGHLKAALRAEMKKTPSRVTRLPFMRIPSEKSQVREGFIERDDYRRILAELPVTLKAIFVCAFHTGARSGEIKAIRWDQINWRQGIIELRPKTTKNSDGRWIPIWGDMRKALLDQKAVRDRCFPECPWVFFWHEGYHARSAPGEPLRDFRWAWAAACERAGVPDLLFHDLRRSAIRFSDQEAGLSTSLTMLMSGHKSEGVFRRYNIRGGRDMSKIAESLNAALKDQESKKTVSRRKLA